MAEELLKTDLRHLNTQSDSEVLLNVFAHELAEIGTLKFEVEPVFEAVRRTHKRCKGAYAAVAVILGYGILAFRDPYGIRPLMLGIKESLEGDEYMVCSESVGLTAMGFKVLRDVAPGEAIFITDSGKLYSKQCADKHGHEALHF